MSVEEKTYSFNIQKISQSEGAWSPKIIVQDIPWQIKVWKKTTSSLSVHLFCVKDDRLSKWSYAASASFKILSYDQNVEPLERYALPTVFDSTEGTGFGFGTLIGWSDLMDVNKSYVKNNAIKLNIRIKVADQNDRNRSEMIFKNIEKSAYCSKFYLTITNIERLTAVKLPTFEIKKSKLWFSVCKYQGHLAMPLCAESKMMLVKLISTKSDDKSIIKSGWSDIEKFISWDELLEPANGFITNNSIQLEVSFMDNSSIQNAKKFIQANTSNISFPRFTIEIPKISKLQEKGIHSPEVMIHGIPWAVKICKRLRDEKQTVFIILYCQKDTSSNWSYAVSFSTKLVPFNENAKAVECYTSPRVFTDYVGYGDRLIEWDDLFDANKCYVKDDTIALDVHIDVTDPNDPNKSELIFEDISNASANDRHKYQLTIKNIRSLVAVQSPQFSIGNRHWYLTIYKHNNQLGIRLFSVKQSFTLQLLVRILSTKAEHSVELVQKEYFHPGDTLCTEKVISWDELLNPENGFIYDNSITLEVEIVSPKDLEPKPKLTPSKGECAICLESKIGKSVSVTACGHTFCSPCIQQSLNDFPNCPLCRKPAKLDDLRPVYWE